MKRISENVTHFGNNYFNYYLVGRKDCVLVECGPQGGAMIFAQQWARLDYKPQVKCILAMHSHFDHVCGLPLLKSLFPEAVVAGSRKTMELLAKDKVIERLFRYDQTFSESLLDRYLITDRPTLDRLVPMTIDRIVQNGDILEIDSGLKLQIIDAPGHSECSIAAYLEPDQFMFISDAAGYLFKDGKVAPGFYSSYSSYLATIKKLMKYPTRTVGPAHGCIVQDKQVKDYYQHALNESQQTYDYIKHQLSQGADPEKLARAIYVLFCREGFAMFPAELMLESARLRIKCVEADAG